RGLPALPPRAAGVADRAAGGRAHGRHPGRGAAPGRLRHRAGGVRALARPRRPVRRDRGHPGPPRLRHPPGARADGPARHRVRYLRGAAGRQLRQRRSGSAGSGAARCAVRRAGPGRRHAPRHTAPAAAFPLHPEGRIQHHRRRPPHPDLAGLPGPPGPAGRGGAGTTRLQAARARRAHRNLRRARRGPFPDHRRARPAAGRGRAGMPAWRTPQAAGPRQHRSCTLMATTAKQPPAARRPAAPRKRAAVATETPGLAELRFSIEDAFERRANLTLDEIDGSTRPLVERAISGLESGEFRVAEPDGNGGWQVNEWLKKAVLLYFRVNDMVVMEGAPGPFWDKVPLRFQGYGEAEFRKLGVRVVPGTVARRGSYFGKDVVLMPSFVNIGAHVGEGTMVDTWATVGSCAQVGKHCHISGGAGIGGVLEPLQASPTIIEDHCFIGARSEVVEGVVVGHHSVIGMGVFIGQSTRIYTRATGEISYGYVPPGSVVVSGSLPAA